MLSQNNVVKKITAWFNSLVGQKEQEKQANGMDDLYAEIYQIEQALARISTKPLRATHRDSNPLVPVTERQRLIDLSG